MTFAFVQPQKEYKNMIKIDLMPRSSEFISYKAKLSEYLMKSDIISHYRHYRDSIKIAMFKYEKN